MVKKNKKHNRDPWKEKQRGRQYKHGEEIIPASYVGKLKYEEEPEEREEGG